MAKREQVIYSSENHADKWLIDRGFIRVEEGGHFWYIDRKSGEASPIQKLRKVI